MDTVNRGVGTVRHRQRAGQGRGRYGTDPAENRGKNPATELAADRSEVEPMTSAIYVRMPNEMADDVRDRAAAAGQGGAEWVRDRIASSLRRPRPRARRQGRAPTPAELGLLVSVQERIAAVGISLQKAGEIEARSPRPAPPRAGYADTVPLSLEILRVASAVLVDLIGARSPR